MNTDAVCTCPTGEYELNQPCRMRRNNNQYKKNLVLEFLGVCNRVNPANNPCIASPTLISCIETDDFGTTFACLCSGPSGPALTTAADCSK